MDELKTFPSLKKFYGANYRRERSPELDFGVMWRVGTNTYSLWRVSWVKATGEVYAHNQKNGEGELVLLLGVIQGRDAIEVALEGWEKICNEEDSLAWMIARLPDLPRPEELKAKINNEELCF